MHAKTTGILRHVLYVTWAGFHNQGFTLNANPNNCRPMIRCVVLTHTTDVYVDLKVTFSAFDIPICLKYVYLCMKYFRLNINVGLKDKKITKSSPVYVWIQTGYNVYPFTFTNRAKNLNRIAIYTHVLYDINHHGNIEH